MNKPETKTYQIDKYFCDICDKEVIQDGKDINLIYENNDRKMIFQFHNTCLVKFLKNNLKQNP